MRVLVAEFRRESWGCGCYAEKKKCFVLQNILLDQKAFKFYFRVLEEKKKEKKECLLPHYDH